jgi:hypothetical protein
LHRRLGNALEQSCYLAAARLRVGKSATGRRDELIRGHDSSFRGFAREARELDATELAGLRQERTEAALRTR